MSEYIKSGAIFIFPSDSVKAGSYRYLLDAPNESAIGNTTTTELQTQR